LQGPTVKVLKGIEAVFSSAPSVKSCADADSMVSLWVRAGIVPLTVIVVVPLGDVGKVVIPEIMIFGPEAGWSVNV
jgi:hypothetical protein